jgi:DNA repair protein SbcD/Mre11
MRFLHVADIHLGNYQYNNKQRYNDFFLAFKQVAELAVTQQIQVCIVAGDLFHKAAVDALTLLQAEDCLKVMREAGIRVLAVAGNHDRIRYGDTFSWLEYLQKNDYLTLLQPSFSDGQQSCIIENETYIDLDGVRFIGVPYFGSGSRTAFERVAIDLDQLDDDGIHFTVLITHTGIEGQIPAASGCVALADLQKLRSYIDYFATGHLHKPFVVDDWIYNPGAIENCDFNEENYRSLGKGVFIVEVGSNGQAQIDKRPFHGRPFYTLIFAVDAYLQPDELVRNLTDLVRNESLKWINDEAHMPVVRVILRGNLPFDRTQLDIEQIRYKLESEIRCLLLKMQVEINGFEANVDTSQEIGFDVLERQIFEEFARSDSRYSNAAESWAALMREVKTVALNENSPEYIYERLQTQMRLHGNE